MQTVVCFGASLTEGTVSSDYVAMLRARPTLAEFRFVNHGKNGDLAWNGLQRLGPVMAERPDFVTILIGTNDVNSTLSERNRLHYRAFNHLPVERPDLPWYEKNLGEIVVRLKRETSAWLALVSLAIIGEDLEHEANRRVPLYNEAIRRLADREGLAFLDLHARMVDYLKDHEKDREGLPARLAYHDGLTNIGNALALHAQGMSWNEVSRRNGLLLTTDCLHLNDVGGGMVADLIEAWLQKGYRAET